LKGGENVDVNILANLVRPTVSPAENGAQNRQMAKPKTESFASKLNNVVERSGKPNAAETVQMLVDLEKVVIFKDETNVVPYEAQPEQPTQPNQPLEGSQAETQITPPIEANVIPADVVGNIAVQVQPGLLQPEGNTSNLTEKPTPALVTADTPNNKETAETKTSEPVLQNADNGARGQQLAQAVISNNPAVSNQDMGTIAVKSETLLKTPEMQTEILTQPKNGGEGQIQARPQIEIQAAVLSPVNAEVVRLNEQPVLNSNVVVLKVEAPLEQNLANQNQSNMSEQQMTFAQTAQPKTGQVQNADQSVNNNQNFTIPVEATAQNLAAKPETVVNAPKTTPDIPMPMPKDDFQIRSQIVEHARLINHSAQMSEMIIRLKPEHLGEMALRVSVNNGIVAAVFHTNNMEVRNILENSMHQLRQELANAGFKVDSVSISSGLSQFDENQERVAQWQQAQQKNASKKGEENYAEASDVALESQGIVNNSKDDGVDYRI
jgi:flagellar hook-length control protein FliK